jgi:hypothetical protein
MSPLRVGLWLSEGGVLMPCVWRGMFSFMQKKVKI